MVPEEEVLPLLLVPVVLVVLVDGNSNNDGSNATMNSRKSETDVSFDILNDSVDGGGCCCGSDAYVISTIVTVIVVPSLRILPLFVLLSVACDMT